MINGWGLLDGIKLEDMLSGIDLSMPYRIVIEEPTRALVLFAKVISMDSEWVKVEEMDTGRVRLISRRKIISVQFEREKGKDEQSQ